MKTRELLRNALNLISLMLCGSALAVRIQMSVRQIRIIDMTDYQIYIDGQSFPVWWLIGGMVISPLLVLILGRKKLERINEICLPLLLLWPLNILLPFNYLTILFSIMIIGLVVFRWKCAFAGNLKIRWRITERVTILIVMIFYLVTVLWSFHLQNRAYRSFFLLFGDWGQYAEAYLNLAFGNSVTIWNYLASGGHWNPLVNLIMGGAIYLYPDARTIFAINALVVYSAIPLCYILARAKHLPKPTSFLFALIIAINPVITNQCLSLFYGFHPINFIVPVLLLFFIFSVRKNRYGMILFFVLSLLIQETVLAFWVGYGLWLVVRRQWLNGIGLVVFSILVFAIISHWILPHSFSSNHYGQMFHYSNLGNTPLEVVMSPLLRPQAFINAVLQINNIAFILTLILPLFILVLSYPVALVAIVPLLAGVCLQDSLQVKTVVLQYGLEMTVFMSVLAIFNAGKIHSGAKTLLPRILNFGSEYNASRQTLFRSSLCATLFLTLASYYFFGLTPIAGKYNSRKVTDRPDFTKIFDYIKQFIPDHARLVTTNELQIHFMFEYPTSNLSTELQTDDVIILDLHHSFDSKPELEKFRAQIAENPRVHPITSINWYYKQIVVFKISPPGVPLSKLPFITVCSPEDIASRGTVLPLNDADFTACYFLNGQNIVFLFRLNRKIDYDVDFQINIGGTKYLTSFGRGIVPAYSVGEGTTFIFELPAVTDNIEVQVVRRPDSKPLRLFK